MFGQYCQIWAKGSGLVVLKLSSGVLWFWLCAAQDGVLEQDRGREFDLGKRAWMSQEVSKWLVIGL